jgi:hypothetical protein
MKMPAAATEDGLDLAYLGEAPQIESQYCPYHCCRHFQMANFTNVKTTQRGIYISKVCGMNMSAQLQKMALTWLPFVKRRHK